MNTTTIKEERAEYNTMSDKDQARIAYERKTRKVRRHGDAHQRNAIRASLIKSEKE